ncbi:hypothetical protein ACKVFX_002987 [Escherichia coli]|nr:hypothetical protein [Escherichia coli]
MQSQSERKLSPKQIAEKIREMRKPHAPKDKKEWHEWITHQYEWRMIRECRRFAF